MYVHVLAEHKTRHHIELHDYSKTRTKHV